MNQQYSIEDRKQNIFSSFSNKYLFVLQHFFYYKCWYQVFFFLCFFTRKWGLLKIDKCVDIIDQRRKKLNALRIENVGKRCFEKSLAPYSNICCMLNNFFFINHRLISFSMVLHKMKKKTRKRKVFECFSFVLLN